jgi:DNA-binding NtrC family response regulator
MPNEKILIVDDDTQLRQLLGDRLEANGYHVAYAANGREGVEQAQAQNPVAILLDLEMPEMGGMEALSEIRELCADTPVIMLTAHGTLSRAVEAMKRGAYDFLPKACEPDHLLLVIRKALERKNLLSENLYLKEELAERHKLMLGDSAKMRSILEMAQRVAATSATVLIEGESGTGKQVMAQTIHALSERRDKPFVQVNCTTLSEQLLESDLFGHEKGAFTGAQQMKKGRVELADGGTLFLANRRSFSILQAKFSTFWSTENLSVSAAWLCRWTRASSPPIKPRRTK